MRAASVDKNGMKKGSWSEEEDYKLRAYILRYGHWNWRLLPKFAGLARCGKSCRLRWMNYLKPGVKRGNYTKEEEDLIIKLHHELGNKWSAIATKMPGRTDNEIKNYWHTHLKKRSRSVQQLVCKNSKIVQNLQGCDVPILESLESESKSESCSLNWDSEDNNVSSSRSILQGSNSLGEKVPETYERGSWDLFGSFWTEQFLVDTDSDIQTESFPVLSDEGVFFSGYVFT